MNWLPLALSFFLSAGHESRSTSKHFSGEPYQHEQTSRKVAHADPVTQSLAGLLLTLSPSISTGRSPPFAQAPSKRPSVAHMEEKVKVKVKVKVKKPSPAIEDASSGESTTVTISKPSASESPTADDDSTVKVKVNVKKPVQQASQQSGGNLWSNLTDLEQKLVDGSRSNATLLLEALQEGVNPNLVDNQGRTVLHYVAASGYSIAMVLLIHFGAQLNVRDNAGLTPAHMAAGYAKARSLSVLVVAGADVNVEAPSQGTPLNIVRDLGGYQLDKFMNRNQAEKITKKKDDRLEQLKACLEVFDKQEEIRKDNDWDDWLKEVLQVAIGVKKQKKD